MREPTQPSRLNTAFKTLQATSTPHAPLAHTPIVCFVDVGVCNTPIVCFVDVGVCRYTRSNVMTVPNMDDGLEWRQLVRSLDILSFDATERDGFARCASTRAH